MSYVTDSPTLIFARPGGLAVSVRCEVARTPAARSRGMMHRATLPRGTGMLFVWPAPEPLAMWMENTPLALDIVFLDAHWRVVGIGRGRPMDATSIPSPAPSQFVLEVPAGWCAANGVAVGAVATPLRIPRALS